MLRTWFEKSLNNAGTGSMAVNIVHPTVNPFVWPSSLLYCMLILGNTQHVIWSVKLFALRDITQQRVKRKDVLLGWALTDSFIIYYYVYIFYNWKILGLIIWPGPSVWRIKPSPSFRPSFGTPLKWAIGLMYTVCRLPYS